MKRLLAILMVILLAASCVACGEGSTSDGKKDDLKTSSSKLTDTSEKMTVQSQMK